MSIKQKKEENKIIPPRGEADQKSLYTYNLYYTYIDYIVKQMWKNKHLKTGFSPCQKILFFDFGFLFDFICFLCSFSLDF